MTRQARRHGLASQKLSHVNGAAKTVAGIAQEKRKGAPTSCVNDKSVGIIVETSTILPEFACTRRICLPPPTLTKVFMLGLYTALFQRWHAPDLSPAIAAYAMLQFAVLVPCVSHLIAVGPARAPAALLSYGAVIVTATVALGALLQGPARRAALGTVAGAGLRRGVRPAAVLVRLRGRAGRHGDNGNLAALARFRAAPPSPGSPPIFFRTLPDTEQKKWRPNTAKNRVTSPFS